MERLKISVGEDGQIIIDRSKKFPDPADWGRKEAYIKVS
jgi:hypothetical protein